MKATFLRTPYNYDTDKASQESGLLCEDETRTKQSFKEEVDINTIVQRFGLTGQMPENVRAPTYADFSEVEDFQSAMNAIAKAREAFDQMPAEVRAEFSNDPARFVDFCSNDANRARAEQLGLVMPRETPKVSTGPVTTSNELVQGAPKTGANEAGGKQ